MILIYFREERSPETAGITFTAEFAAVPNVGDIVHYRYEVGPERSGAWRVVKVMWRPIRDSNHGGWQANSPTIIVTEVKG